MNKNILYTIFFMCFCINSYTQTSNEKNNNIAKNYKISLILPLFLNDPNHHKNNIGQASLDYYEGFVYAMNKLKSKGLNITINVFDDKRENAVITEIVNKSAFANSQLIVGSIYEEQLSIVNDKLKNTNVSVISPFKNIHTQDESNIINMYLSDTLKWQAMGEELARNYGNYKIVMYNDSLSENYLIRKNIRIGYERLTKKELITIFENSKNVEEIYKENDSVLIIAATQNTYHIKEIIKKFGNRNKNTILAVEDYSTSWGDKNEIENSNFIFMDNYFADKNDTLDLKSFRSNFASKNNIPPSKYAYSGYQQAMLIGESLIEYGDEFDNKWRYNFIKGGCMNFLLKKRNGAWQNFGLVTYKFHKGKLVKIR